MQALRLARSGSVLSNRFLRAPVARSFGNATLDITDKGEGESTNQSASKIIEECLRLRGSVQTINDKSQGPLDKSTQKNTVLPFVFLLGNHSSGKSSFINYVTGRKVQTAGVAPTDDTFTIIAPGPSDSDRDGPAFIGDPDMGFSGLKTYGPQLVHHTQLKVRSNMDFQDYMIVDTPGMIDSPMVRDHFGGTNQKAVMDRGYDFEGVCKWYAERADVILLFFDPDKPGTTGETLQVLTNSLIGLDHKLHIILNKADQFRKIHDFARAYGSLCWNLSKVIQRKDLPRIYTMCLPPSYHALASGDQDADFSGQSLGGALADLETTREEVLREVNNAPKRRVDNEISRLSDSISVLHMHCSVIDDIISAYRKAVWGSRAAIAGAVTTVGGGTAGALALDAPLQIVGAMGGTGTLLCAGLLWYQNANLEDVRNRLVKADSLENTFRRLYVRQLADKDEFTLSLWTRVKDHMKVGLRAEDLDSLSAVPKSDMARLDRLVDVEIPELRRDAQPSFNK